MKIVQTTERIPAYLSPYIATQDPSLYTPMDHASWRFILSISKSFFADHAHQKYLSGLKEAGISSERIPLISEMDQKLRKFHWRAVPVTGFIPPAVFMEFLSLGVLPIACDMRNIEHLAYTPAPDIVHEAAGHAPIIADPEYASYLRSYGEISRKAIFSSEDMDVYNAIRLLSDTKEDPNATAEAIDAAQEKLDRAIASVTEVSEAALLARMGWWTFEYGMVGTLSNPKIYGAGLLSSMGESYHCFDTAVKKVLFSIDCIQTSYDITRPQPQLFVSPDFQVLEDALDELANQMAFRQGGVAGLEKAIRAQTVTTTEFENGAQVSGVLSGMIMNADGTPGYLKYQGPSQLSYRDEEIAGQGADYHREGFGTPVGQVTDQDLEKQKVVLGSHGQLQLKSGVTVTGKLVHLERREGKLILLTFEECTVKKGDEVLFRPEWGKYDMICGQRVVSVFGGAADRERYLEVTGGYHQEPGRQKSNLTAANRDLNELYARVRRIRDGHRWDEKVTADLGHVYQELEDKYPDDWLLRYELLELSKNHPGKGLSWEPQLVSRLVQIAKESEEMGETIQRGLRLLAV